MLQHGASKVYAVDVGYGQLHDKLRRDERVVEMERTNARNLTGFPDEPDLVTIDASFISLKILLPVIKTWNESRDQRVVALIKPQFEVGRDQAAKGKGVVRDSRIHEQVVADMRSFALAQGYQVLGVTESPLTGPKGNKEFLIYLFLPANK
jgi:23S rRNA (cytidine1920-2'-O)/16S rRNA (cytidine1409-2'-O)-methyltransferase